MAVIAKYLAFTALVITDLGWAVLPWQTIAWPFSIYIGVIFILLAVCQYKRLNLEKEIIESYGSSRFIEIVAENHL